MTMTEEQKENARNRVNAAATALLALLAGLTQVGCKNITPAQIQGAHNAYHAVSGKPCIFVIESK